MSWKKFLKFLQFSLLDFFVTCPMPGDRLLSPLMSDLTHILNAIEQGDPKAADSSYLWSTTSFGSWRRRSWPRKSPARRWTPRSLVHEAYLRLVGAKGGQNWDGRRHFFAAAAEAMRRILIENARRKRSQKHGGDRNRQELEPSCVAAPDKAERLLAMDEALTRLAAVEPQVAELVKLRYFAGLTNAQAASQTGNLSPHGRRLVVLRQGVVAGRLARFLRGVH